MIDPQPTPSQTPSRAISPRKSRLRIEAIGTLAQLADTTVPLAIRAVCKLGVADHLRDGARTVEELAAACGAHAPSLLRVLRALATRGVFAEPKPGSFALTEIGDLLRSDHRLSMRMAFRSRPDLDALAQMDYSVRTGEPAFDHIFDKEYFDYLSERPELVVEFQASQRALSRFEEVVILRSYDWSKRQSVVDIGGGDGAFLSHLLATHPQMRGTLFDLPNTVKGAPKVLAAAGVADRCEVIGASFMERDIPAGADVYLIKRVLVGLDDAQVSKLFKSVRKAMRPDSRLLVLEPMMAEGDVSTAMDLLMLVLGRGRVRTPEEFHALFAGAKLKLSQIVSKRIIPFIEAEPV
jgi:hypothetical protein